MNFYEEFARSFFLKPGQALIALYWHLTRRRVRARNHIRRGSENAPYFYPAWIRTVEQLDSVAAAAASRIVRWSYRPRLSLILNWEEHAASPRLSAAISSVVGQCYDDWELLVIRRHSGTDTILPDDPVFRDERIKLCSRPAHGDAEALRIGLGEATGDYIIPLPNNAMLPQTALFRYVEALQGTPRALVLYGDQDCIDKRGTRSNPWFKSRWNEEMFLAQDYVSTACALDAELVRSLANAIPDDVCPIYALLLMATGREHPFVHVPHITCHRGPDAAEDDIADRVVAVARHLEALGATAEPGPYRSVRVRWPLPQHAPRVSIIIPTRDQVKLLKNCVESLLTHTTYNNYDIVIVDNDSAKAETFAYLDEISRLPNVTVLSYCEPYNYSAINNFAVTQCQGEYCCFLNNDTLIVDGTWLHEMMRQATRPEIGAVGAKLLYDDGSIQHAGVVIGIGGAAGHAHRNLKPGRAGYFARPHIAHFVSAVTAACLVMERRKFELVGGFDEQNLAVAFNDVDLCLKLEKAGLHNVYVPHAVLVHLESRSRGKDSSRKHIARYSRELAILQERWGTLTYQDPLHHPALDPANESYVIKL